MTYIFTCDWPELQVLEGYRLFPQDGMWYYKTTTEADRWVDLAFIQANPDKIRNITALELLYNVEVI